jgi:hypothetical protein
VAFFIIKNAEHPALQQRAGRTCRVLQWLNGKTGGNGDVVVNDLMNGMKLVPRGSQPG